MNKGLLIVVAVLLSAAGGIVLGTPAQALQEAPAVVAVPHDLLPVISDFLDVSGSCMPGDSLYIDIVFGGSALPPLGNGPGVLTTTAGGIAWPQGAFVTDPVKTYQCYGDACLAHIRFFPVGGLVQPVSVAASAPEAMLNQRRLISDGWSCSGGIHNAN